ncbi:uncharacterized protein LOC131877596 isoform X2 [Tigriopus californicus]|nr:uncharacterized protein LOC131877596 isoform X2 [Tigriopus californicus]
MDPPGKTLKEFLTEEKSRAQERIRQCQIFLQDSHLECGTVRESLEQLRSNAEDDFGTFLHLLTVCKTLTNHQEPTTAQVVPKSRKLSMDKPKAASIRDSSEEDEGLSFGDKGPQGAAKMSEAIAEEFDPLDPLQEYLTSDFPASAIDDMGDESRPCREEDDHLTTLPRSNRAPGVSMGRFMATRANGEEDSLSNMARSLPVSAPINPNRTSRLPPELEEDDWDESDEIRTVDIHNSIQTIAKSLHVDVFGELPRSKRMFQD